MKYALIFTALIALASAAQAHEVTCDAGQNDEFTITTDSKGVSLSQDGGELGGDYSADSAKDTASYSAFKIVPRDQDGEQPAEVKVEKSLLTGTKNTQGNAWLAPGIVGGTFRCKVSKE